MVFICSCKREYIGIYVFRERGGESGEGRGKSGRVGEWERGEWESGRENWGEGGERIMILGFRVYLVCSISICKVLGFILNIDVRRERGKKKEGKKGEE